MAYTGRPPAAAPLTSGDIPDGSVTAADLASGAAASNLGYTPVNKTGDTMTGDLIVNANVGIGTSSNLLGALTVFNGTDFSTDSITTVDNIYLISDATSGDGVYGSSIAFSRAQYPDRRVAAIASVQTGADEDNVGLAFFTHPSGTASNPIVESMRIDSSGRVTMPYQPAFFVWDSAPADNYFSGNYFLGNASMANTVNIGSHWNFSTGRFTAPVAGRYFFFASFLIDSTHTSNTVQRAAFKLNGTDRIIGYTQPQGAGGYYDQTLAFSGIIELAVNDQVTLVPSSGRFHRGGESSFGGYLLG